MTARWLESYASPTADVADLLCDRHDPQAVAFTFIAADLSSRT